MRTIRRHEEHRALLQIAARLQERVILNQRADTQFLIAIGDLCIRVTNVLLDGDTILLKGGERVRLLGINAPEIESSQMENTLTYCWLKKDWL